MAVEPIRRIDGKALPLAGNNIDTDRIIPARFLRSVSFEGLEAHLFADDRTQADALAPQSHPMSNPSATGRLSSS
jgi:3-isopropylmalate/(R)-2-methylmalate dehydratase small subunit